MQKAKAVNSFIYFLFACFLCLKKTFLVLPLAIYPLAMLKTSYHRYRRTANYMNIPTKLPHFTCACSLAC